MSHISKLHNVRNHFCRQPIFRTQQGDLTAYFGVTDFTIPLDPSIIEDMADCMNAVMPLSGCSYLVSIADCSGGALVHALATRTNLPYTLTKWYEKGTSGEIAMSKSSDYYGDGGFYINGLRRGNKVAIVVDVLKSGATTVSLIKAVRQAGCHVVCVAFGCEIVEAHGRELILKELSTHRPAVSESLVVSLVKIHLRGEMTKESLGMNGNMIPETLNEKVKDADKSNAAPKEMVVGADGITLSESTRESSYIPIPVHDFNNVPVGAEGGIIPNTQEGLRDFQKKGGSLLLTRISSRMSIIKGMSAFEIDAKKNRVLGFFLNVPIIHNPVQYCLFSLTDFSPPLEPSLVEDLADLSVYLGNYEQCDVVVSKSDRGGGPLAQAISVRVCRPYVLSKWYQSGEGVGVSTPVKTRLGVNRNIVVNGIRHEDRCIYVGDMLSSGGTSESVLRSVVQLGGIPIEGFFACERLYPPAKPGGLPQRDGKNMLNNVFPYFHIITLAQFLCEGNHTCAPPSIIGE
eukprot:Tbor_TRINITY_DN5249_c0_g4::TRINITY_DN5249_c0_g4_i1::g.16781::m.16781